MQFPESWLREFCNPPLSTQQLADTLTMAGLEVEELAPVAPPFTQVVVGEIKSASKHPNADKLQVCEVDVGQDSLLSIVCGAPNARVGIKVPCALVGAQLPPGADGKPFVIQLGELRGVQSQGMLCSARELKLSEDHGGLLELAANAPLGLDIREHLDLDDTLFTLKLTPNLAHCLSVFGVARELAALTGAPLHSPRVNAAVCGSAQTVAVTVSAPDLCGRFSGRVVLGVNPQAKTPDWMVSRLARCGQRSVTALVDISNYVMFESGQPTHIFDLGKIHGALDVRWGKAGETLELLNGNTVSVDEKVGVIADSSQVESLAGIMGGNATAVSDDTTQIYLEAAFWWPKAIAGRSRRYNFSTDAGHRFERGVDPSQTLTRIERITQLVLDICATPQTQCGPITDIQSNVPVQAPVTLRVARAAKVIGMPVTQEQCAQALRSLGCQLTLGEGAVTAIAPPYRFDLQIEEDLIEEVTRLIGYQHLPQTPPLAPMTTRTRSESARGPFAVRRTLAGLGYQETINFSFVEERWEHELAGNPQPIKLLNPIASQMGVMRSSLLGSLLRVLKFNLDRKAPRVNVFELGRVFLRDAQIQNTDSTVAGFDQPMRVGGLAWGPRSPLHWDASEKSVDFFDVKGDVQALLAPADCVFAAAEHPAMHPGRCASVQLAGRLIGYIGELHPKWCQQYELTQPPALFELELDAVLSRRVPVFQPISKLQSVERDVAVIVAEAVTHDACMGAARSADTQGLLKNACVFDIYRPQAKLSGSQAVQPGEKSIAIRLELASDAATLTEADIDQAVKSVLAKLEHDVHARLRA